MSDSFTSYIDKKYFWHFCWLPYLYTFSLYENASFIIFSAETEYISTITIPHIFQTKFKKVKHATLMNKWSICWSSSSITYLSPVQQVVGIPMGRNCAPLLADLFLCSYESKFLQKFVKDTKIHEARAFNITYR